MTRAAEVALLTLLLAPPSAWACDELLKVEAAIRADDASLRAALRQEVHGVTVDDVACVCRAPLEEHRRAVLLEELRAMLIRAEVDAALHAGPTVELPAPSTDADLVAQRTRDLAAAIAAALLGRRADLETRPWALVISGDPWPAGLTEQDLLLALRAEFTRGNVIDLGAELTRAASLGGPRNDHRSTLSRDGLLRQPGPWDPERTEKLRAVRAVTDGGTAYDTFVRIWLDAEPDGDRVELRSEVVTLKETVTADVQTLTLSRSAPRLPACTDLPPEPAPRAGGSRARWAAFGASLGLTAISGIVAAVAYDRFEQLDPTDLQVTEKARMWRSLNIGFGTVAIVGAAGAAGVLTAELVVSQQPAEP